MQIPKPRPFVISMFALAFLGVLLLLISNKGLARAYRRYTHSFIQEDYSVYSALIRLLQGNGRYRAILVKESTITNYSLDKLKKALGKEKTILNQDTIADFERRSREKFVLQMRFNSVAICEIVNDSYIEDRKWNLCEYHPLWIS